jgi:osmotically-inducible protein OsmY
MRFQFPFIIGALLWVSTTVAVLGDPVTFKEVSLLVRMKDSPAEIGNQVTRRKLSAALTAQEIETLRAQGASEQVIQIVQDPRNHLSAEAAAQFQRAKAAAIAAQQNAAAQLEQQTPSPSPIPAAPAADDRNTELKSAKESVQ